MSSNTSTHATVLPEGWSQGQTRTDDMPAEMFGVCPDCGSEECEDWDCHRDEFERALEHDENESDDNPPMFSVVGRLVYDKNADRFTYWDHYSGREVAVKW